MTLLELLVLPLVAGVVGAIGQTIAGFSRGGCFTQVAVGFVGDSPFVTLIGMLTRKRG